MTPADDAPQLPSEVLRILFELEQDFARNGAPLSLARLSKRTELRMSTLRRYLTLLEEAGVVTVTLNDDGTGHVLLITQDPGVPSAR